MGYWNVVAILSMHAWQTAMICTLATSFLCYSFGGYSDKTDDPFEDW